MFRKELIGILQHRPASLHDLAMLLEEPPKALEDDLRHLIKSLRHMPYQAIIEPASCRKCGFVFRKDKLHKPGKCPRCHGIWISDPLISIEEKR
jgi:predicted Zn-ribbon and HTH transcriptional regulator